MSRLEVYTVGADGDLAYFDEARNAWGGAVHTWLIYGERLGIIPPFDGDDPAALQARGHFLLGEGPEGTVRELWRRDRELPAADRWVLRATYDRALIARADLPTYLVHLRAFAARHPTPTLDELLVILDRAAADPAVRGVGFQQTSVAQSLWWVYGAGDDEDGRPYNVDRDAGHWWLDAAAAGGEG